MLRGIGTSGGIGIGHVLLIKNVVDSKDVSDDKSKSAEEVNAAVEREHFDKARQQFIDNTNVMIDGLKAKLNSDDNTALILKNQIYLASDEELVNGVYDCIDNNMTAEDAIRQVCGMYAGMFAAMDSEVMRQRVADIEDIKDRLICILTGEENVDLSSLPENTVIVADELRPSITANMDTQHVAAIVAMKGGETSHAAILARALEIPAVLSVPDICNEVADGDDIIVDGEYGEVFVKPLDKTVAIYRKKKKRYDERIEELKQYIDKDTRTKDDERFCLAANIGNDKDCAKAMNLGAEGVGLFRTEFFFLEGNSMPTEEVQFEAYKRAAVLAKGRFVTIRTLDIGGDKDIPYMGLAKESNPFLGYRAIRYCLGRVDVFITQLKAIIRASAYGNIRIMLPLVTNVDEVISTRKIISDICKDFDKKEIHYDKNIQVGVMIETPAAAIISDQLAKEVDFFSIGTNDLTQYTLAIDRQNPKLDTFYRPHHEAILRLIRMVAKNAHEAGIWAGICGELGADMELTETFLEMGIDELSVSPACVLPIRKIIRDAK